jgi:hypothetical protein
MSYYRYFCVFTYSSVQQMLCCVVFSFVFLRLVFPMLQVSLDCPLFIGPLVCSNVYIELLYTFHGFIFQYCE